ncbi:hypothetical protein PMKS-000532 [Pichia membranifaciens]|uniref:Transcription factor domain-containing protein n=1 Tax=Pichia membranifaciens TaxID=4926 RepID=A0A1Q2YC44_9ASCO|nr:hypothetical protein PMKS-000532 [Pichia membranifaciens]
MSERNLERGKNCAITFVSSLDYPNKKLEIQSIPRSNVTQNVLRFDKAETIGNSGTITPAATEWLQQTMQIPPPLSLPTPTSLNASGTKPCPASDTTLADKLTEREYLKKRLAELEKEIAKSSDCFSMVIGNNNENLTVFRSKRDSRFICLGTFVNTSVWKRDPLMCNFFKRFFSAKKSSKYHATSSKKNNIVQKYCSDSNKSCSSYKAFEFLNTQLTTKKQEAKFLDKSLFIRQIEEVLPPCDVIQFHIEHFMKYIYPFIPVIDEHIFRMNISKILQYPTISEVPENSTGVKVCIVSKSDGLRISILLLIMRLSYLSVFLEIEMTNRNPSFPEKRILSYQIGPAIVSLVQYALQNTNFLRKTSAETLQLLLLYRFYQVRTCEDGDGFMGSDGTVMTGLIVATAKAVGLDQHFDENIFTQGTPAEEKYNHIPKNKLNKIEENGILDQNKFLPPELQMNLLTRGPRVFNQLWKKLWWASLQSDLNHSMIYGSAPQFDHDPEKNRTGKAVYDPGLASVRNTEIERLSVSILKQFSCVNYHLYQLLEMLHSFKRRPTVDEVEAKSNEILNACHTIYDGLNSEKYISSVAIASLNVNNAISKLEIYGCMMSIEYSLLLHCEQLGLKEENGTRSQTLGFANVRFSKLFPRILSNWIIAIEDLFFIWQKLFGYEIFKVEENERGPDLDGEFAPYLVLLVPVINIVFVKLISVLFYVAIRLLVLHYQIRHKIIPVELTTNNTIKMDEYVRLYKHIIILFKSLIVLEGKLSKYWYSALRAFTIARKFVEWFEFQEKWLFTFTPTSYEINANNNDVEKGYNLDSIIGDTESKATGRKSLEFFLHLDTKTISELNLRLDGIEERNGLKNIHSAYVSAIPRHEDKANQAKVENTSPSFHSMNTPKSMLENLLSPSLGDEHLSEPTDSDAKSTGAGSETINFLESLETDNLDGISGWFNHTALLESLDFDTFKQDFDNFI